MEVFIFNCLEDVLTVLYRFFKLLNIFQQFELCFNFIDEAINIIYYYSLLVKRNGSNQYDVKRIKFFLIVFNIFTIIILVKSVDLVTLGNRDFILCFCK